MDNKIKNTVAEIIVTFVLLAVVWGSVGIFAQALKCPWMTQTELFLNIPESFLGNWSNCI